MENDIIVQLPLKEFDRLKGIERQLENIEKEVGDAVYFFACEELRRLGVNEGQQTEFGFIISQNVVNRIFPDYLKSK